MRGSVELQPGPAGGVPAPRPAGGGGRQGEWGHPIIHRWYLFSGQVGVLLLAGGQGTRLGVNHPKGMFDIGLPSGSSLYQVQAERVLRLEQLAGDITGNKVHKIGFLTNNPAVVSQDWRGRIPLYMMTSEHTKLPTQQFFKENNYFGLQA